MKVLFNVFIVSHLCATAQIASGDYKSCKLNYLVFFLFVVARDKLKLNKTCVYKCMETEKSFKMFIYLIGNC